MASWRATGCGGVSRKIGDVLLSKSFTAGERGAVHQLGLRACLRCRSNQLWRVSSALMLQHRGRLTTARTCFNFVA